MFYSSLPFVSLSRLRKTLTEKNKALRYSIAHPEGYGSMMKEFMLRDIAEIEGELKRRKHLGDANGIA